VRLDVDFSHFLFVLQILPLALIIAPALSFVDWWIQTFPVDPVLQRRLISLTIDRAHNLSDRADGSKLDCFCVISISDDDQIFVTWIQPGTSEPVWGEHFVLSVTEVSAVLIQVFDTDRGGSHRLIGYTIFTPLHNSRFDIRSGNPVYESSPLRCDGLFGNQFLDYVLSSDIQQSNVNAAPSTSTLSPQGHAQRIAYYITLYATPLLSPLSLTYRVEEVSQTLGPTGQTLPAGLGRTNTQGQAQAAWFAVSTLIPSISYGFSFEQSPTRLPDPVREPPVAFQPGSRINLGSIGRQWVPGLFNPLEVNIPVFGRRISVSVPFIVHSRTPQGFALSVIAPSLSWGIARARPLPL